MIKKIIQKYKQLMLKRFDIVLFNMAWKTKQDIGIVIRDIEEDLKAKFIVPFYDNDVLVHSNNIENIINLGNIKGHPDLRKYVNHWLECNNRSGAVYLKKKYPEYMYYDSNEYYGFREYYRRYMSK